MANDFFEDLGKKITKTAEGVGKKTSEVVEQQRLRSQIGTFERDIKKHYEELGKIVYKRYEDGEVLDIEFISPCEEINQKKELIEKCENDISGLTGRKKCKNCDAIVDKEDVFCRRCGELVKEEI